MIRPISMHSTPRKCSTCLKPAAWWAYKINKFGQVDESSRQPKCEDHKEAV